VDSELRTPVKKRTKTPKTLIKRDERVHVYFPTIHFHYTYVRGGTDQRTGKLMILFAGTEAERFAQVKEESPDIF
jgi:hypothetical protein